MGERSIKINRMYQSHRPPPTGCRSPLPYCHCLNHQSRNHSCAPPCCYVCPERSVHQNHKSNCCFDCQSNAIARNKSVAQNANEQKLLQRERDGCQARAEQACMRRGKRYGMKSMHVVEQEERQCEIMRCQQALMIATQDYEQSRQDEEHAAFVAKEQENAFQIAQVNWKHKRNAAREAAIILEGIRTTRGGHGCYTHSNSCIGTRPSIDINYGAHGAGQAYDEVFQAAR